MVRCAAVLVWPMWRLKGVNTVEGNPIVASVAATRTRPNSTHGQVKYSIFGQVLFCTASRYASVCGWVCLSDPKSLFRHVANRLELLNHYNARTL